MTEVTSICTARVEQGCIPFSCATAQIPPRLRVCKGQAAGSKLLSMPRRPFNWVWRDVLAIRHATPFFNSEPAPSAHLLCMQFVHRTQRMHSRVQLVHPAGI
jgi:hypothetical protein